MPVGARAPHVRDPSFWLSHLFQACTPCSPCRRARRRPAGAARADARAARGGAGVSRRRARDARRAALGVRRYRARHAGRRRRADRAGGRDARRGGARARPRAATPRRSDALEALARFGRALRDEIEPSDDPHAFAVGEEQFSRRLHYEHALGGRGAGAVALRAASAGGGRGGAGRGGGRGGRRSWRDVVERLREDAPAGRRCSPRIAPSSTGRAAFLRRARARAACPRSRVDVVPTPSFLAPLMPFAAYEPPPVHLAAAVGAVLRDAARPGAAAGGVARQRREHCVPRDPVARGPRGVSGAPPAARDRAPARAREVRRHLWTPVMVEGWALYCEQLMAEAGYYRTPEARLFQLVNLLWRAVADRARRRAAHPRA